MAPAPRRRRTRPIALLAAIAAAAIVAGSLIAGSLASSPQATARIAMSSNTSSTASPASLWSTQLQFDHNGTPWSEASFAALKADGLITAEINMPWNTIEPKRGTFSFSELDQELANASAARIRRLSRLYHLRDRHDQARSG